MTGRLDAARAGSDQPDALALEVDAAARPAGGVVRLARKAVPARDVGQIGVGKTPHRGDQKTGAEPFTAIGNHPPPVPCIVELGAGHAGA